jgi:hypothetical protein
MDIQSFKNTVIKYGGEGRVLSLVFNNAYTRTFDVNETFSFAEYLDEEMEYVVFTEKDTRGIPYTVVKPVEYIEAIVFATNDEDMEKLDRRYIRS